LFSPRGPLARVFAKAPGISKHATAEAIGGGLRVARLLGRSCLDLLAPGFCRQCQGAVLEGTDPFCARCLEQVEWIGSACARCGIPTVRPAPLRSDSPLSDRAELPPRCGYCKSLRLSFDLAVAAGRYSSCLRTAIIRYKFGADQGVRSLLHGAVRRVIRAPAFDAAIGTMEAIVPVPLHPLKRWWRGRDPVLELSRQLSAELAPTRALPVLQLLEKVRPTRSQVKLSGARRRKNLRRSLAVRPGRKVPETILLVDDVLTTGTTASECARALKRRGAKRVLVVALARS
jgi:competence protein ComFC